jgi:hypothetical protein
MDKAVPQTGDFYQHRYGGLYVVHGISTSTVDKSKVVVYNHVYPFEYQMWHRPYDEWIDGRFRKLSTEEKYELLSRDRETFQKEITEARTKAKMEKFTGPKEGDTRRGPNNKVQDFRNGQWVTVQG